MTVIKAPDIFNCSETTLRIDLWQNQRVAYSGSYPDLVQYPGSPSVNSVKVNKWGTVLSIPNIDQEYFFGVKFENGAFEGYPFSVARTNVPVKDMDMVESYYGSPYAGSTIVPYIPALWNSELTGANANFTDSLTISGVSVSTGVGGGGGTPGGSDTNVQFNDGGSFGGSSSLIYSNTANYLSGASGIFDHLSGHTGYFRDYASGATGEWDFTTGSTGHWEEEVIVGTGDDVALIANDAGNVGIGWSGTPIQPIGAQLHVSGSTIISGSSEVTLDYDRLPKSNPNIKGRVWIEVVSGFLMISSTKASSATEQLLTSTSRPT